MLIGVFRVDYDVVEICKAQFPFVRCKGDMTGNRKGRRCVGDTKDHTNE